MPLVTLVLMSAALGGYAYKRRLETAGVFAAVLLWGVSLRWFFVSSRPESSIAYRAGEIPASASLATTLVLLSLGGLTLLVYEIGRRSKPVGPTMNGYVSRLPQRALATASLSASAVLVAFLVRDFGGLAPALRAFSSRTLDTSAGLGYVLLLADAALVLAVLAVATRDRSAPRGLGFASLATAAAITVLLGSRGEFLQLVLTLLLLLVYSNRGGLRLRVLPSALGLSMVILVTLGGLIVRMSSQSGEPIADSTRHVMSDAPQQLSNAMPLLDSFQLAQRYVDQVGHDDGEQFLTYPGRIIPRSIWDEKPLLLGIQIRQLFWGDRLTGVPATVWGEGFIAAGWVAVLALAGLLGVALRRVQTLLEHADARVRVLGALLAGEVAFRLVRSGLEVVFMTSLVVFTIWRSANARQAPPGEARQVELRAPSVDSGPFVAGAAR